MEKEMKALSHRLMGLVIAGVVAGLWPSMGYGQELAALDLTLKKTSVKTSNVLEPLAPWGVQAFTPTTVSCPNGGTCLVRVEVATQVRYLYPTDNVAVTVLIDGHVVAPNPTIVLASNTANYPGTSAHSFSWAQEVTPGPHVIEVRVATLVGFDSFLDHRSLTISVYKP
jgi:hypothetical protein